MAGKVKKNCTISDNDQRAYSAFTRWLPYYFATYQQVPDDVRFEVMLNRYPSVTAGCIDIALHVIENRMLAREAQKALQHMQSVGRPEVP